MFPTPEIIIKTVTTTAIMMETATATGQYYQSKKGGKESRPAILIRFSKINQQNILMYFPLTRSCDGLPDGSDTFQHWLHLALVNYHSNEGRDTRLKESQVILASRLKKMK